MATGIARNNIVDAVYGFCACVMAAYVVYSALQQQQGNGAVLSTQRVKFAGYACLAVFAAGFIFKAGVTAQRVFA